MMKHLLGRPIFGHEDEDPFIEVSTRVVNLDEKPGDRGLASGSILKHGKWVLSMVPRLNAVDRTVDVRPVKVLVEWAVDPNSSGITVGADDTEGEVYAHVRLAPVIGIYGSVKGVSKRVFRALGLDYETVRGRPNGVYETERTVSLDVHDGAIWWNIWMPSGVWESSWPRWRHGNIHVVDLLFGEVKKESVVFNEEPVLIPMAERNYSGWLKQERNRRRRARWPFHWGRLGTVELGSDTAFFEVKMDEGHAIPFPGKGENPWDGDEDALFSLYGQGATVEDAVAAVLKSVMRRRRR